VPSKTASFKVLKLEWFNWDKKLQFTVEYQRVINLVNVKKMICLLLLYGQIWKWLVYLKKTASGVKDARAMRLKILELAQQRYITAILVTELSRWGRSTVDLVST
jgi:hypothetical protein